MGHNCVCPVGPWTALYGHFHVRMPSPSRPAVCLQAYATDTHQPKVKYNRQLWLEQPQPDNYTDETFLQSLQVNGCTSSRNYWQVVSEASAVTQQTDTVVSVAAVSTYLYKGWISPIPLLVAVIVPVVFAGCYCLVAGGQGRDRYAKRAARQITLLTAGVYFMSPLLQTLTRSVSSDSIVALVCGLLVMHLYLHDYSFMDQLTDTLTGSMSLTAATFASVLVASQLKTQLQVFAQVLFSLELYLLFPHARRHIKLWSATANQALTIFMHTSVLLLLFVMSLSVATLYAGLLAFVTFFCPLCLMRVQKCKAQITGPWDEAVPCVQVKPMRRTLSKPCRRQF